MKKNYLWIAAAAALFAACSDTDAVKEAFDSTGPKIDFATFAQKATRAENSSKDYTLNLEDHHNTFKVWGFKNTSADAVFFNETVTHQDADPTATPAIAEGWTYVNNRYWDKNATDYYYYACAPASATTPFVFNGVSTDKTDATAIAASKASQPNGYFTIPTAYTTVGENVSAYAKSTANPKVASATKVESWTAAGATDVDLMIADVCHLSGAALTTAYTNTVQLNFIHILSRLNITVKTAANKGFYPEVNTGDKIVVNNITVGHMNNSGTFDESTAIASGVLAAGTDARWTATGDHEYSYDLAYDVDQTAKYVIETLMLPQALGLETITPDGTEVIGGNEPKPYLYINYTIWNNGKTAGQTYEGYYNLATILTKTNTVDASATAFNEGWVNTINITIDPDKINFDANVAQWDDNKTNDLKIY